MEAWSTFWAAVLGLSLASFLLLAVVVTIGGWKDLRAMLAELSRRSGED